MLPDRTVRVSILAGYAESLREFPKFAGVKTGRWKVYHDAQDHSFQSSSVRLEQRGAIQEFVIRSTTMQKVRDLISDWRNTLD